MTKRQPQSSLLSAADELAQILGPEHVAAVIEFRRVTIKKPLTAFGAKLLAREFAKCPDPNQAAEIMIAKVWRGFDASWLQTHAERYQMPGAPLRGVAAAREKLRKEIADDESRAQGQENRDTRPPGGGYLIDWEGPGRPH